MKKEFTMEQREHLQSPVYRDFSPLWAKPNAREKSFIDQAAARAAPYLADMCKHPFIQELIAGTLDIGKAKFYTTQLAFYLEGISSALATIAGRDHNLLGSFLEFAGYVLSLQKRYAGFYPGAKPPQSAV